MSASEFDDKFLADITKVISQDMEDAIMGSILGFATTEQEKTSICFEDITEMCSAYGRANQAFGYSIGYSHQELPPEHRYDMEYEIKFLGFEEVLKDPDSLTPEAKFDMAMKAVI